MLCEPDDQISGIIEAFQELIDDTIVPKNVRAKLSDIVKILKDDCEISLRVSKALEELDSIANDTNLQSYTRTEIWNVASLLEML